MKTLLMIATFASVLSLAGSFGLGLGEWRDHRRSPQQSGQYDERRDRQWSQQQNSQRQQQHNPQQHRPQDQLIIKPGNR